MAMAVRAVRGRRLRSAVGAVAGAALAAGAGVAAALMPGAAHADTGVQCQVTYSVTSDWGSGFGASIVIKNVGTAPWSAWTLGYSYAGNQTLQSGWNGTWSQSGSAVTVVNAAWNGSVAAGGTVNPAANFVYSGTNTAPAVFSVNGTVCNGATPPPTTPTTPSTTPSTTPTTLPTTPSTTPTTPPTTPTTPTTTPASTPPPTGAPALHVAGNQLLDSTGKVFVPHGVNRSGAEFACVQGKGIFDGPVDDASVAAIAAWKANIVRVPLNEDCWLGASNVPAQDGGAAYQSAIESYVATVHRHGLAVILDLHWTDGVYTGQSSACSVATATCQKPMPDAANAPAFWSSVASAFKNDPSTVFDLFNEPYPDFAAGFNSALGWSCWQNGGSCTGIGYQVAGMQSLVTAVRNAGAGNVLMLGGVAYSNDLSQWLQHKPSDPLDNLVASWHSYNFNSCSSASCWDSQLAPVLAQVPVIAGEIGENDCGHSYIDTLMAWLDAHHTGYAAWTWNTWDCSQGPSLISAYDGTPTNFGAGYKAHLATF